MSKPQERRNFERVAIPLAAGVYVTTPEGQRAGNVVMLGRGGFLLETKGKFSAGQTIPLVLVDEAEGIRTPVRATVRYASKEGVGFEFVELNPDAAVEVGVVVGKHYSKGSA